MTKGQWQTPGSFRESSAARLVRWSVASLSFSLVVVLFLTMDFADRGYHFEPDRYASNVVPTAGPGYDLSRLRVLTRCVGYVRANYVDPERADARKMLLASLDDVERRVPEFMADPETDELGRPVGVVVSVGGDREIFDLTRVDDLYTMSWKMLDIFKFVTPRLSPTVDPKQVEYAAVNGMLRTLDPHSVLLTPSIYREMKLGTTGKFGGLGIVIGTQDGRLVVQSVMDGTPAREAGLKSGDRIVQIEAESTLNMSLRDAVQRLRGPPGTPVSLWIDRKSFSEPRKFRIIRANITLASVTSELLDGGVGYAQIKNFQQSTAEDLESAVRRLIEENRQAGGGELRGLVLDLRDNPGGLLDQAIEVSDLFLRDGVIVTTVGSGNKVREEKIASALNTWSDLPLVVLVNEGSASASEIVAGALRNNDRAVLMGTQTFGKGSVQVIYDIDDAALKLTIAQYLTPGDESIQSVGITPHVALAPVVAQPDHIDLNLHDLGGERMLTNHLSNGARVKHHEPSVRVSYLQDDGEDRTSDFAVRLARRMITEAGRASARELLARSRPLFSTAEREQTSRLVEALGKLDIDWNDGPRVRRSRLTSRLEVVEDSARIEAGRTVTLRLTVTNEGSRPVHRVRGYSEAPDELFADQDFLLGRIPPGETRTWDVAIDVPRSIESKVVPVRVPLYSGDAREALAGAQVAETHLQLQGLPRPRFGFTVMLDDVKGNGDGLASEGETVRARLRITNVGLGAAHKTLAALKNRGGEEVFITEGRQWIDGLAPGQSTEVEFALEVREGVPHSGLDLDVQITDTVLGQRMTHRLPVPFVREPTTRRIAQPGRWQVGHAPLTLRGARSPDAVTVGALAPGATMLSDARVGDWLRIPLDGGGYGWTPESAVSPAPASAAVPQAARIEPVVAIEQPVIDLGPQVVLKTRDAVLRLSGAARFPWLDPNSRPDVYIFRDADKVYFERGRTTEERDLSFATEVPLAEGLNEIAIHARSGRDLRYEERLWVYRTK